MSYLRNNKTLLLIIAVLLMVNILLLYGYFNREPKRQRAEKLTDEQRMQMAKKKLQDEVGFTDEQSTRYIDLRKKHFEGLRPMFDELRTSKDSLFNLIYNPSVSDSLVSLYAENVSTKQKAIDMRMVNYMRSLKELATEEQRPRMDSFLLNMTRKMAGVPGGQGGGHKNSDRKEKDKKQSQ